LKNLTHKSNYDCVNEDKIFTTVKLSRHLGFITRRRKK